MSAQFITHDEFDAGQDRLFMRLTAFMTGQLDLIKTQAREDSRAVIEQVRAVTARIDTLEQNVNEQFQQVNSRIDTLEQSVNEQFQQVNSRIDTLEQNVNERFQHVDERFDKLEGRMSGLEAAQTALKAATEGYARDTSKQIADSHAIIMEQINQLKRPPEQQ